MTRTAFHALHESLLVDALRTINQIIRECPKRGTRETDK